LSFKAIAITVGAIVALIFIWWGWTEVKVWWKTRELKAVQAATQEFQKELEASKAEREAALVEVRKNEERVKALTQQIKTVVAAADRDRQARRRLEQQAAAREPEITRLREMVAKLQVERQQLAPVSGVRDGVLELRKRGY
jgi:chromosome segregation ATPase